MPTQPLILITNDDGITSPGLLAIAEAVADLGQLLIAAPATQQTGMGRSSPQTNNGAIGQTVLRVHGQDLPGYAIPGSPAQAVMYAILALSGRRPALAISGINFGENIGTSTTASGTIGAAMEAATYGIPALAVSLETPKDYHYGSGADVNWDVAALVTRRFAQILLTRELPFDVDVLKIDVPSDATPDTPWRLVRQSRQAYYESFPVGELNLPELGHFDYRISVKQDTLEPDSDIQAFAGDRVISVVPISIDLTSRTVFSALDGLLRRQVQA
jgi:5'-nucleotidase